MDDDHQRNSATKSDDVGQGKLYSPDHAIKIATSSSSVGQGKLYSPDHAIKLPEEVNPNCPESSPEEEENEGEKQRKTMLGMKKLGAVKDKVLEKLAAASVPSESLENAKQYLEGAIKDFAGAAQGMTKDALHRIKTQLSDILPSVSPAVTGKMVDDAEKEAINGEEEDESKSKENSGEEVAGKLTYVSPIAKPLSRL